MLSLTLYVYTSISTFKHATRSVIPGEHGYGLLVRKSGSQITIEISFLKIPYYTATKALHLAITLCMAWKYTNMRMYFDQLFIWPYRDILLPRA